MLSKQNKKSQEALEEAVRKADLEGAKGKRKAKKNVIAAGLSEARKKGAKVAQPKEEELSLAKKRKSATKKRKTTKKSAKKRTVKRKTAKRAPKRAAKRKTAKKRS